MEQTLVEIRIIPKYGKTPHTINYIKNITYYLKKEFSKNCENITQISATIKKNNIYKLAKLRKYIDFLVVDTVKTTDLDNEFKSITSDRFNTKEEFVLYSPTAKEHKGKMSKKSDAVYHWIIERNEPQKDGKHSALLLQSIKPNGITSFHYHVRTNEKFLSLFGRTSLTRINCISYNQKCIIENLGKDSFTKINPGTAHQLETLEQTINLIHMNPYDPKLNDHHTSIRDIENHFALR